MRFDCEVNSWTPWMRLASQDRRPDRQRSTYWSTIGMRGRWRAFITFRFTVVDALGLGHLLMRGSLGAGLADASRRRIMDFEIEGCKAASPVERPQREPQQAQKGGSVHP
jgi:hypothetical protein